MPWKDRELAKILELEEKKDQMKFLIHFWCYLIARETLNNNLKLVKLLFLVAIEFTCY